MSISFRACELTSVGVLPSTLKKVTAPDSSGDPSDVAHLDVAENELQDLGELGPFDGLLSLDASHNNIETLAAAHLAPNLRHLNASYNRLESATGLGALSRLVELNLGYNLLSSVAELEGLTGLRVLLLAGNRLSALHGLAGMRDLELLDLRHNYVRTPSSATPRRAAADRPRLAPGEQAARRPPARAERLPPHPLPRRQPCRQAEHLPRGCGRPGAATPPSLSLRKPFQPTHSCRSFPHSSSSTTCARPRIRYAVPTRTAYDHSSRPRAPPARRMSHPSVAASCRRSARRRRA